MTRQANLNMHNQYKTWSDRKAAGDDVLVDTPDSVTSFAAVLDGANAMDLTWVNPATNAGELLQIERAVVSATAGDNGRGTVLANTFTDSGDLVTDVAHGLIDGDTIVFDTVVTTTGVSADVPVYVVTATDDTFQVEATLAGGALTLTTDGTGTYRAVQFVDFEATGNTVDRTAHGFVDGDIVIFGSIVTTTGITADVRYYVVNATTDTFQVEATVGGGAITLTSNGTGDVYHPTTTFEELSTACTFTDVGNLVTQTANGLSNGDQVIFATIVTTTGIAVDTVYYVVGVVDANDFQVSATPGGAALVLTTDGSGTTQDSVVQSVAHGYAAGQRVMFSGIVSTTGLVEAASYYVIEPTADTFKLSADAAATAGAVELTTAGYGILAIPSVGTYTVQDTVEADDLAWSDTGLTASTEYQYRAKVSRKTFEPEATAPLAYDQTSA